MVILGAFNKQNNGPTPVGVKVRMRPAVYKNYLIGVLLIFYRES